jgi:hypothetical protein
MQVVDAEVPKGKRPVAPLYFQRTRRANLFGILQRADEGMSMAQMLADGGAVDDTWLGYKGRRVVPGPELRRGRKNLYDVVHHTCVEGLRKNPSFTGVLSTLVCLHFLGERAVPSAAHWRTESPYASPGWVLLSALCLHLL